MNEQPTTPVKRSFKVKFAVLIGILIVILLVGNWFSFQQTKHILLQEIQTRGVWITRNLAYNAWDSVRKEDKKLLDDTFENLSKEALHEADVMYIIIVNHNDEIVFSKSKYADQTIILPDAIRQVPCGNEEPLVYSYSSHDQQLYDVRAPIIRKDSQWNTENDLTSEPKEEHKTTQSGLESASQIACPGTLHIGLSLKNLDTQLAPILSFFLLLSGCIIFIGITGYAILSRILIAPILQMAEIATRISQGNLRQTIEISSTDEIGVLEIALLHVLEASKTIAARLKKAGDQIKIASDEMLSMSEEQSSVSQKQSASIYHIRKTIEDIAGSSRVIAENSDSVARVAEATLQAIQDVEEMMKKTITGMQAIRDQMGKNSERVGHLGEKVSQIGNVVKMINTIADQTKLIAFNASIEAAGAGETGGRFSIVAIEVRRLANTVVESLEEIRELVSSIQTATSELILSSETEIRKANQEAVLIAETGNTLQHIMEMIDKTTQSAKEISISTQHQQTEHSQIVKEIKEIADGSEQSVDMSARTTEIAKELRNLATELDVAVQNIIT